MGCCNTKDLVVTKDKKIIVDSTSEMANNKQNKTP